MPLPVWRNLLVQPGYLCLPEEPARLCAIAASGVAVTIFDRAMRRGGMGHYAYPARNGAEPTPLFAAPALYGLVDLFRRSGSKLSDLETFIYGGADNPGAPGFDVDRGKKNVRLGLELLKRLGVAVTGSDTGGRFGRQLVFYTATGECIVAKVTDISREEWYPRTPARQWARPARWAI